jgi:hypothetical protein
MICVFVLLCLSLTVSFRTPFKRINTRHESTKIFYERLIDPSEVGAITEIKQIDLLYGIHTYIYMNVFMCIYLCIYMCIYTYIDTCIYVYIFIDSR